MLALFTAGAAAGVMAVGAVSPTTAFSAMLTKFGLASICGYQVPAARLTDTSFRSYHYDISPSCSKYTRPKFICLRAVLHTSDIYQA